MKVCKSDMKEEESNYILFFLFVISYIFLKWQTQEITTVSGAKMSVYSPWKESYCICIPHWYQNSLK